MFRSVILLLISLSLLTNARSQTQLDEDKMVFEAFGKFLKQFNKNYTDMTEFMKKYEVFKKNYLFGKELEIQEKNNTNDVESSIGLTPYFDMTPEEFEGSFLTK